MTPCLAAAMMDGAIVPDLPAWQEMPAASSAKWTTSPRRGPPRQLRSEVAGEFN
ncbi:hypothetical protein M8494_10090 [Serratia ureilytica]